jgi:hypothetical protein
MQKIIIVIIGIFLGFAVGWFSYAAVHKNNPIESITETKGALEKPYEKYGIPNLINTEWKKGSIKIEKVLGEEKEYTSYLFSFTHYPALNNEQKIGTDQKRRRRNLI